MSSTIMLSKTYDRSKGITSACHVTEKLDGVACKFTCVDGEVRAVSRSGKLNPTSVDHIIEYLTGKLQEGCELIGELYVPGWSFKRISGAVRRKGVTCRELSLYVYY